MTDSRTNVVMLLGETVKAGIETFGFLVHINKLQCLLGQATCKNVGNRNRFDRSQRSDRCHYFRGVCILMST